MPWDPFLMKKLLNKVLAGCVNSAWDPLEKHNLMFSKKKKKKVKHRLSIQTGTKTVKI